VVIFFHNWFPKALEFGLFGGLALGFEMKYLLLVSLPKLEGVPMLATKALHPFLSPSWDFCNTTYWGHVCCVIVLIVLILCYMNIGIHSFSLAKYVLLLDLWAVICALAPGQELTSSHTYRPLAAHVFTLGYLRWFPVHLLCKNGRVCGIKSWKPLFYKQGSNLRD